MGTEQHQECLQEMLNFLDRDSPDEIRFSFLKKIFLTAATESISDRNSVLPQQYMKICRILSSGEVLVLQGAFSVAKQGGWDPNNMDPRSWLALIAEKSGLRYRELVENQEKYLIDKNLITPRTENNRSLKLGQYYRVSELGYGICEFIESYEGCNGI